MRNRIFEIIEIGKDNDKLSQLYDLVMFVTIIVSLIPLTEFSQEGGFKNATNF